MTKSVSKRNRLGLQRLEERLTPTAGYFRIVSYNISAADNSGGIPTTGLNSLLYSMGDEPLPAPVGPNYTTPPNQVVAPIDVIALQEVDTQATTSAAVVTMMNSKYGANTYGRGTLDGATTGSGTQGVVYNKNTLQLYPIDLVTPANSGELLIGTASASGQPRQAMRYKFHPIGYPTSADFYVYVSHTKSDTGTTNQDRRNVEALAIRADADTLGAANIIYTGDFNTYTNTEPFFTTMMGSGAGQAADPINRMGSWHTNASYNDIFTQSPTNTPGDGLTTGGLDDRFDFQLITGELIDGFSLNYVPSTYHTFGVNGSIPYTGNAEIDDAANNALPYLSPTNQDTILGLLKTVTDHLPVVADYKFELPPTVTSVTINDGSAQRSRITSVTVNFSRPVTYPNGINTAFQLTRQGDSASVTISATPLTSTSALLTFTGGAVNSGSLADGRYNLLVVATSVSSTTGAGLLDGNNDMIPGGNYSYDSSTIAFAPTKIFRLFGDSDGNGTTDQTDYNAFRLSYFGGPSAVFDYNSSSQVDQTDYNEFRLRFLVFV